MSPENILEVKRGPTPTLKRFATDNVNTSLQDSRPKSSVGQIRYTLTYVIKKGYFNLVHPLLSLGADPNHVDTDDRHGMRRNALIYTTFIRDEKWALSVARCLLENGADLSLADSRRLTPIHYCCAFGRSNLLSLFLNSLDFDLSRALDLNGNTCFHYAIRSRNIKCIRMLLDKYGSSHMAERVDIENAFGLRPSQIEDVMDELKANTNNKNIESINLEDGGIETILVCREELLNFIKKASQVKLKAIKHLNIVTDDEKSKVDEVDEEILVKKTKKRSKSLKKPKIPKPVIRPRGISISIMPIINVEETVVTKIETTTSILEDHIDEIKELRIHSKKLDKMNFNHKITKRPSTTSLIQTQHIDEIPISRPVEKRPQSAINENIKPAAVVKPAPKPMDTQTAKILTHKSFLIDLRDLLQNYIEYNGLFRGKEDMTLEAFAHNRAKYNSPVSQSPVNVNVNLNRAKSAVTSSKVDVDWKTSLPAVFYALECYMSPNYRETVRPPVSTKVKNNNKDFTDFKAKLKRNSTIRMGRRKTAASISHHLNTGVHSDPHSPFKILTVNHHVADRLSHRDSTSIAESDVIVASLPFLRKNSCWNKKNSTDSNSQNS